MRSATGLPGVNLYPPVAESWEVGGATGRAPVPQGAQAVIDAVAHLQSLSVTQTMVPLAPARSLSEHLEGLHWVAEEIIPAFR